LEKNISHELTDLPSLFRILLLDSKFHMYTFESLPEDIRYLPSDVRDGDDRAFDFQGPAAQGRKGRVMIAKVKNDCFSKQIKGRELLHKNTFKLLDDIHTISNSNLRIC
jgi:hypothetical protein